jgi:hypothetical protein
MRRSALPCVILALSSAAFGQHLIVTAEGHDGAAPPEVEKDTVSVEINKHPARVDQWAPLRGQNAALQLYVVIDDGTNPDVGSQFGDLKKFISAQPASTQMGLAYLRYGAAQVAAPMTADHAAVAMKLRIPLGDPGVSASPYMGISDLIKKWPAADARREMLVISSGIDPWSPPDPRNPYLQSAIADAQRAGIPVHSIYFAESGHLGHSYWRINWGQSYLSELGDETGGEAYWEGTHSPVSFAPLLKELDQRLRNQYLLTVAAPDVKAGLQSVRVMTTVKGVSLMSASKIDMK